MSLGRSKKSNQINLGNITGINRIRRKKILLRLLILFDSISILIG